jgi:hypothetical protein
MIHVTPSLAFYGVSLTGEGLAAAFAGRLHNSLFHANHDLRRALGQDMSATGGPK